MCHGLGPRISVVGEIYLSVSTTRWAGKGGISASPSVDAAGRSLLGHARVLVVISVIVVIYSAQLEEEMASL